MSDPTINNRIVPQTTQQPTASAQQTTTPKAAPQAEPVFEPAATSGSNVDTLEIKRQEITDGLATNNQNKDGAELTIEQLTEVATVAVDTIAGLEAANEVLALQNAQLNSEIRVSIARIGEINSRTREIKAQIDQCSGFTGTLVNGLKNVLGMGVDVNALRAELANLENEKAQLIADNKEKQEQIRANNGQVEANLEEIELNDGYIQDAEAQKAETNVALGVIQGAIKGGEIALEDVEAAIKDALENPEEPVDGSKANNAADGLTDSLGEGVTQMAVAAGAATAEDGESGADVAQTGAGQVNLSQEQITGLATSFVDVATNGDLTTDTVDALYNAAEAQDPTTGEFNAEAVRPIYEESGFTPEEIETRLEIVQAITSYAEMGLEIDVAAFESASVIQLDEMIESAMVQDTIKATSTMVIGKGAPITSKKDMQKNSESVDSFIDAYSTLNSYYQANNVENLEVKAFLNLSNDKISKINNGYVYGTSELQELTNNAGSMMTTLRTAISLDEAAGESASIQFEENKHRADDAINTAEGKLNENDDTTSIDEFRAEFLNLTSKFNSSDSDSAKQVSIRAMEALYQRALNADNGVDKDPYRNQINIAA